MKTSGISLNSLPPKVRAQVEAQLKQQAGGKCATPEQVLQPIGPTGAPRLRQSAKGPNKTEAAFAALGLPRPISELRFSPPRQWRFDFAWPAHKVALEVEGGVWTGGRHTRGSGFLKDMEKYNAAAVLGWRVVRCTPNSVTALATVQMVAKMLE